MPFQIIRNDITKVEADACRSGLMDSMEKQKL